MAKTKGVKDKPHKKRCDTGLAASGEYIGPGSDGRTCVDCQTWKPATDYWVVSKTGNLFAYCKDCGRARSRAHHKVRYANPEYRALNTKRQRAAKRQVKEAVIRAYGGGCACCGETLYEFLTLDHKNGDGAKHRKESGVGTGFEMWRFAYRNAFPDMFRILCWNCNSSRGAFGYCPHEVAALLVP